MYKISVPIMNSNFKRAGREKAVKQLKELQAERVFLALDRYETDAVKRKQAMSELKENCAYLKAQGYEVAAWIWTFWISGNTQFGNMRSIYGTEIEEFMCPLDKAFVQFACGYIKDIAACGVDMIMFDDDFRYGALSDGPACLCDRHIAEINRITGENSTREELCLHITTGEKNKYRDAYLKANGDAFREFARAVRGAVDAVNAEIRLGACACMSSWDIDGVTAAELAHILAGKTRPFVRLIGAPYWATVNKNKFGDSLQDIIELERMESAWTRGTVIEAAGTELEIMAEGDAYPRPRTCCPANYVEGFDTALRAAGCTDGILKYGIDYVSNADYETGYARFHKRNQGLYEEITQYFAAKKSCGVRVYEAMHKISDMVCPRKARETVDIQNLFYSMAARTLAFNSIPTVYGGRGVCGIVFGESAASIPKEALQNGLIIDTLAAEIMMERGIDVGIEKIGKAVSGAEEHFLAYDNHILAFGTEIYDVTLKNSAEVLSDMETEMGILPVSFRYENADGNRFLILNVKARPEQENLLKHYARSRQLAEQIQWLGGQKLPAYIYGNPALYMQCKKDETAMAVGLWNFWADTVIEPVVQLNQVYTQISFINCGGRLEGDKVYLTEIHPYGFAGFEVK